MKLRRLTAIVIAVLMLITVLPVYAVGDRDYSGSYYHDNGYEVEDLLYETGTTLSGHLAALMTETHEVITTYNNTRDHFVNTDADPAVPGNILLIYSGASVNGTWDQGTTYNREHVWPKSLTNNMMTDSTSGGDLYHIRPENGSINSQRGNHPAGWVDTATAELTYNGVGTGSYVNTQEDSFEPRDEVKGDLARIYFYLATRWGLDMTLPVTDTTFQTLLEWNVIDPADSFEMNRNNYVETVQGNRNVFVDYPEFARLIWGDDVNGFDYEPVTLGDYTFYVRNGGAVILSYNGNSSQVEIPEAIGGAPVTAIGCAAFANNSSLKSVTVPASVTSIGTYAFYNDVNLASVIIGGEVTCQRRAFRSCPALKGVYFSGAAPTFLDEGTSSIMISGESNGAVPEGFKLYYVEGQSGWTGGSWSSGTRTYEAAVWNGTERHAQPVEFTVGTVSGAHPGDTVTVPVTIQGEYEASTLTCTFTYDSANLTLNSMTKGEVILNGPDDMFYTPDTSNPGMAVFSLMMLTSSLSGSGTLVELSFTVADTCASDQTVELAVSSFAYLPVGEATPQNIESTVTNGAINIVPSAPSGEGSYVLVTDIDDVTDGDYVLYGVNGTYTGAMNNTINNGKMGASAVTVVDDTIVDPEASVVWHMARQTDGSFTLYNAAAGIYCMITGENNNTSYGFATGETATCGFTVTAKSETDHTWCLTSTVEGLDRMICLYQSDFRTYKISNYKPLYLYKFVEGDTPEPTPEPTATPEPTPEPVYYTVRFVDWDETLISEQSVREHEDAVAPEDPVREGYTFTGWDTDYTDVTSDLTVTATYSANQPAGLLGDVNDNGKVDFSDVSALASYLVDTFAPTAQGVINADVDGEDGVNSADLIALYRLLLTMG